MEVSVGNCDIHFVAGEPGYYDGCQQVLVRDETCDHYNIIGGKYNSTKEKIVIHTLAFSDAIWNNPDMPIDYSDLSKDRTERYKQNNDKTRQEAKDCANQSELEYFTKHIRQRAGELDSELDGLDEVVKEFFKNNISPDDPIPKDIPWQGESYITRRNKQWLREVNVAYSDIGWILTKEKKNDTQK